MTAVLNPVTTTVEVKASDLYRALSVVSHFASTDHTIPMLCQVRLEGDGAGRLVAVATDRYVLGTLTIPYTGPAFTAGIELADVKTLLPLIKKLFGKYANADVTLKRIEDDRFNVSCYSFEQILRTPDDEYPRWRALIPEIREGSTVDAMAFNPNNLAKFAKATESKNERVCFYFTGPLKPARVEAGDDFVGLIMPMRMEAR